MASCARCLNSAKQLKQIQEVNQLVATVAEVSADIVNEKAAQKVEDTEKKEATIEKKMEAQAKEAAKKATLMPQLQLLMEDFIIGRKRIEDLVVLPRQAHQHILKHCYNLKPNDWTKLTKQQLCEEIAAALETAKTVTAL